MNLFPGHHFLLTALLRHSSCLLHLTLLKYTTQWFFSCIYKLVDPYPYQFYLKIFYFLINKYNLFFMKLFTSHWHIADQQRCDSFGSPAETQPYIYMYLMPIPNLEHFHHSRKTPGPTSGSPLPLPQPLACTDLLSLPMDLPPLDNSCKSNHSIDVFLCLASFTWHNVFEVLSHW